MKKQIVKPAIFHEIEHTASLGAIFCDDFKGQIQPVDIGEILEFECPIGVSTGGVQQFRENGEIADIGVLGVVSWEVFKKGDETEVQIYGFFLEDLVLADEFVLFEENGLLVFVVDDIGVFGDLGVVESGEKGVVLWLR